MVRGIKFKEFSTQHGVVVAFLLPLEKPNLVSEAVASTKQISRLIANTTWEKSANFSSIQLLKSTLKPVENEAHGRQQAPEINSHR